MSTKLHTSYELRAAVTKALEAVSAPEQMIRNLPFNVAFDAAPVTTSDLIAALPDALTPEESAALRAKLGGGEPVMIRARTVTPGGKKGGWSNVTDWDDESIAKAWNRPQDEVEKLYTTPQPAPFAGIRRGLEIAAGVCDSYGDKQEKKSKDKNRAGADRLTAIAKAAGAARIGHEIRAKLETLTAIDADPVVVALVVEWCAKYVDNSRQFKPVTIAAELRMLAKNKTNMDPKAAALQMVKPMLVPMVQKIIDAVESAFNDGAIGHEVNYEWDPDAAADAGFFEALKAVREYMDDMMPTATIEELKAVTK